MRNGKPRLGLSDVIGYTIGFTLFVALAGVCAYFCWSGVLGLRHGGLVVGGGRGSVPHLVTRAAQPIQYWLYELLEVTMPLLVLVPVCRSFLAKRSQAAVFRDTGR